MTLEELKIKMESLGFKYQPGSSDDHGPVGQFFRRVEVKRECLTNEAKVYLAVDVYDRFRFTHVNDALRYGLDVHITGEFVSAQWAKLMIYGVTPSLFFEKHTDIERALLRAWEAMA